jgi:hypothetical protein
VSGLQGPVGYVERVPGSSQTFGNAVERGAGALPSSVQCSKRREIFLGLSVSVHFSYVENVNLRVLC